jgi:hypothetical protein
MATSFATKERLRREQMWGQLDSSANPDDAPPRLLAELRVYRGQAGTWTDLSNTSDETAPHGVTVSVLLTGHLRGDELRRDGVTYHVAATERLGHSESEIAATMRAMELGLPVFVITSGITPKGRQVRRGNITGYDGSTQSFEIRFL